MTARPMRVLFFTDAFWPRIGGIEVVTARLVPGLAARGHEMLVVTDRPDPRLPEEDELEGVPIRRLPFTRAIARRDVDLVGDVRQQLSELARAFAPDVVHAVLSGPSLWFLPRLASHPMIVDCHGSWPDIPPREGGLITRLVAGATRITACSRAAMDDVHRLAPGTVAPVRIIPLGLDPRDPGEPGDPAPGPPVLLCSGRAVPEKGMDVAVAAMVDVLGAVPDARLIVAGDGPVRPALGRQAGALGIADRVELVGWVPPDRTHELAARASIVLVPSRIEGFGIVALEAALMARPVVASAVGGLTEAVEDGVTGVLVPPEEPAALAAAVTDLLREPGRARALGRAARRRALSEFSATRYVDRWDDFYDELRGDLDGS